MLNYIFKPVRVNDIIKGKKDFISLGNIYSKRDWGHAEDYVKGMYQILNHDKADDFVISTMKTHSVREMCDVVFKYLKV